MNKIFNIFLSLFEKVLLFLWIAEIIIKNVKIEIETVTYIITSINEENGFNLIIKKLFNPKYDLFIRFL